MQRLFIISVFFVLAGCTGQKIRHLNDIMEANAAEDRKYLQLTDSEIEKYSPFVSKKNMFYIKCKKHNPYSSFSECLTEERKKDLTDSEWRYVEHRIRYGNLEKNYPKHSLDEAIEKKRIKTR